MTNNISQYTPTAPNRGIPMCLAIPGKILSIDAAGALRMGVADFGGVIQEICLEYTPEISVGDYAIVHVGFAIAKLDLDRARSILDTLENLSSGE